MTLPAKIDLGNLTAIDVHVHIDHGGEENAADAAAAKYFGKTAPRGREAQAEYYRSRKMGCVIFTVDERLTGRPGVCSPPKIRTL